jgi:hypothetical protein
MPEVRLVTAKPTTFRPIYRKMAVHAAAKLIQAHVKAKQRQKEALFKQKYPPSVYIAAATLMQAMIRGKRGRKAANDAADEAEVERYQAAKRDAARKKSCFKPVHPQSYYTGAAKLIQGVRRRESIAAAATTPFSFRLKGGAEGAAACKDARSGNCDVPSGATADAETRQLPVHRAAPPTPAKLRCAALVPTG